MKNILFLLITLLLVQFVYSQDDEKQDEYNINNRKGQLFVSWGWNRSSYSKSDIEFKGNDYNFTLNNVKADDKPKPFGISYFRFNTITNPQTNFRMGYFFKNNYNIVLGLDHMKYVMRQDQNVIIDGEVAVGNYTFEGVDDDGNEFILENVNFDDDYTNQTISLSEEFLKFEHTDGLNYIFVQVNRFDNFNKLLGINSSKFEVNLEEGIDIAMLYPKTNTTILGRERYDKFQVTGYGLGAKAAINLTFFKHFYLQTDFKFGFINMSDIRTTQSTTDSAKQHFTFFETAYTFGYRFSIF